MHITRLSLPCPTPIVTNKAPPHLCKFRGTSIATQAGHYSEFIAVQVKRSSLLKRCSSGNCKDFVDHAVRRTRLRAETSLYRTEKSAHLILNAVHTMDSITLWEARKMRMRYPHHVFRPLTFVQRSILICIQKQTLCWCQFPWWWYERILDLCI